MSGSLGENALFTGVAAASLARVLPAFRVTSVPRGTVLYDRGAPARYVFLIVSGSVAVIQQTAGIATTVALLGPGEFTGECALLVPVRDSTVTAVCTDQSRIAFATSESVLAAIGALPAIGLNVARGMHRRVRDAASAIDELTSRPALRLPALHEADAR